MTKHLLQSVCLLVIAVACVADARLFVALQLRNETANGTAAANGTFVNGTAKGPSGPMPGGPGPAGPMTSGGQSSLPEVNGSRALLSLPSTCTGDAAKQYTAEMRRVVAAGVCNNFEPKADTEAQLVVTCGHPCVQQVTAVVLKYRQCITDQVAPVLQACTGVARNQAESVPETCAGADLSAWRNFTKALDTTCKDLKPDFATPESLNATFCSTACFRAAKAGLPSHPKCAPPMYNLYVKLCERDTNGELCGAGISKLSAIGDCEKFSTQAACEAKSRATCKFSNNKCRFYPGPNSLPCDKDSCQWQAFEGFVRLAEADPAKVAETLAPIKNIMCAKSGKDNCLFVLRDLDDSKLDGEKITRETLGLVCNNSATRECMKLVLNAGVASVRDAAAKTYVACVLAANSSGSQTRFAGCVETYYWTVRDAYHSENSLQAYCNTDSQKNSGKNCVHFLQEAPKDECFAAAMKGTCATGCGPKIKALTDQLGCCGYYIASVVGDVQLVPFGKQSNDPAVVALPLVSGVNVPIPARFAAPPQNPFAFLTVCKEQFTNKTAQDLTLKCSGVRPGQEPPKKQLATNLRWSQLKDNAEVKRKMEDSMTQDVATNLGLAKSAVQNGTLREDTSRKVKAGRQTETAAAFDFVIVADNPTDTEAAAAAFDTKATAGSLTLANTASTVSSDCSSCAATTSSGTSSGLDALAAVPATTTTPAPAVGGSSRASAALVAIVVAALVAAL